MPCFRPWSGFKNDDGSFSVIDRSGGREVTLPCGRCVGCVKDHQQSWSLRLNAEFATHNPMQCWFVTLTQDDEHCPEDFGLCYSDVQRFFDRVRKRAKFRYFVAGEYGERSGRPHYHVLFFGLDLPDARSQFETSQGHEVFASPFLTAAWGRGLVDVRRMGAENIEYTSQYVLKGAKLRRDGGKFVKNVDSETGEVFKVPAPFVQMSRRPGIGRRWIERFHADVTAWDALILPGGARQAVPRYFQRWLKEERSDDWADIEARRYRLSFGRDPNERSEARLAVKEFCALAADKRRKAGSL